MNDSKVLAFVERWALAYWHVEPVHMSIVGRPGRRSNYYEVEVVLPCDPQDRGILRVLSATRADELNRW